MNVNDGHNKKLLFSQRYQNIYLLNILMAQARLNEIKKIGRFWDYVDNSLIINPSMFPRLVELLDAHQDAKDVKFILERIAASNDPVISMGFNRYRQTGLLDSNIEIVSEGKEDAAIQGHSDAPLSNAIAAGSNEPAEEFSFVATKLDEPQEASVIEQQNEPVEIVIAEVIQPELHSKLLLPKSGQGISRETFERILDAYHSTSLLSKSCCFFNPLRSISIRELKKILSTLSEEVITKEQIETALSKEKDSERRLSLFQGVGTPNSTGTDKIILDLREQFKSGHYH